jgi:hypothetical protein
MAIGVWLALARTARSPLTGVRVSSIRSTQLNRDGWMSSTDFATRSRRYQIEAAMKRYARVTSVVPPMRGDGI